MNNAFSILIVCGGSHVAGQEIVNLTLMKQLAAKGHSVFCLASGWNDGSFVARLKAIGIPYQCVKLGNLYLSRPAWTLATLWNLPKAVFQVKAILKKFKPDIVLLNDGRNFLYTSFLWEKTPLIYWEHNLPAFSLFNKISYNQLHIKTRAMIACSDFVSIRLNELIQDASRVVTIHNGIEIPDDIVTEIKSESGNSVRIGIVGQIIPRKGHLLLLEALNNLRQEGLDFTLMIYGNDRTSYAEAVRAYLQTHHLAENIVWKGFESDKSAIYSHLDLTVVPSSDEPFGLVALEPALWEIPVIAARSGGLAEIVEHEVTGLLFTAGDAQDLSVQLKRLIQAPALRREMGRHARAHLLRHFTASRMCEQFIEIFKKIKASNVL